MTSFWIAAIGIVGTLSASVLTQWLQSRSAEQQRVEDEKRRISDLRREAMATFADALMSYRRAQLHNWHEAIEHGIDPDKTLVSDELRQLRARAWSTLYRVELLWEDATVVDGAKQLIDKVTNLKHVNDRDELGDSGDRVREDLSRLVDNARRALVV